MPLRAYTVEASNGMLESVGRVDAVANGSETIATTMPTMIESTIHAAARGIAPA